jgi:LmbE family N-acetylglucosaminyl deacetylase
MKVDILAFGAHPDDVELSASATLLKHIHQGKKVALVDLTQGELGSRGTIETRYEEASLASKILGIEDRVNLKMADGFFEHSQENLLKIVEQIRHFKPEIVLAIIFPASPPPYTVSLE